MISKEARLVIGLIDKTNQGAIGWEKTEQDDVFQVAFPNYSVRIGKVESKKYPGNDDIVISIYNEEGKLVDEYSDIDLKDQLNESYIQMKSLHERARRKSMGVDEALDDILSHLGSTSE